MSTEAYNDEVAFEEVQSLFNKQPAESLRKVTDRKFAFSNIDDSKKLLFIGINPSFRVNDTHQKGFRYESWDPETRKDPYFKYFFDVVTNTPYEKNWAHIDLFYFRQTEQNGLEKLMNDPEGLKFLVAQLQITQKRIEALKPDLIIVANSAARLYFGIEAINNSGIWMGYDYDAKRNQPLSEIGMPIITGINENNISHLTETELVGVPVLFSSILKYQDWPARQRMNWHIEQVAKMKKG